MLRRFAVPVLIGAIALSAPGMALATWTKAGTGSGYSEAAAITAPTGVTPTTDVNSSGNVVTSASQKCVPGAGVHLAYVKITWSGPASTFGGETYTIAWTEQAGGSNGASGSTSGATTSPTVVQVASSGNGVQYSFTVTSVLGSNWAATSSASSTVTVQKC